MAVRVFFRIEIKIFFPISSVLINLNTSMPATLLSRAVQKSLTTDRTSENCPYRGKELIVAGRKRIAEARFHDALNR